MKLKGLLKVALVLLAVSSLFVACDTIAGGKWPVMFEPFEPEEGYIYLKPNENWLQNDGSDVAPRFAVYTSPKDWSSADWYDMEETEEDSGIYKVKLPADKNYYNIIFCRMNGSKTENNWDNKYNQSKDEVLVYADDDASNDYKVLYIVADGSWDKSSDSFWHNPGEYVGNIVKYTVTFTADSGVTGVPEKQEVKENTQINAPAEPSKEGYIFEGWYDGDTKITFPYTVTKDVTLKAKFKEMPKEITDVVYSYTVKLNNENSWEKNNSSAESFLILAMTDEQVATKTLDDEYKRPENSNITVYTHEDGSYWLKKSGESVSVAAVVANDKLTVYYRLPKEDVAAGRKAYIAGLGDDDINFAFDSNWSVKVMKMTPDATMPTDLKENTIPPFSPEEGKLYLLPNDNWSSQSARFAAVFVGSGWSNETWVDMRKVENSIYYEVEIPSGSFTQVQFQRMNPDTTENNWDNANKWNSSKTLDIPVNSGVYCKITGWSDTGEWIDF